jgi:alkanesulfonate monooxygenase SsuD/methylene tetrahydromethanopterin reductase-like flavin-dependent oxidoreductase (luciferase family)
MKIGMALPTMADGWSRDTYLAWCPAIDAGPFSSISCGERITFRNVEMLTTLSAAAALTERVDVFVNLAVSPWHSTVLLAKQLATLDVISGGRLTVGLGVGGREQDYEAVGAPFARRHHRLDDQVGELGRLWSGVPPVDGAPPLGPTPTQVGGPPLLSGAMGPKAMRRAAAWAEGISGFSLNGDPSELVPQFDLARSTWRDAGRTDEPRLVFACFYVTGDDAANRLRDFTYRYLEIFGAPFATGMADAATLSSPDALREMLEAVEATGCDEVVLVPGDAHPACLDGAIEAVSAYLG